MMSSVPQFTDVEDKIAGPLTWRQILWMIGMGGVLLVLYNILNSAAFFVAAIPVILVFSLFAFYRPNGVSMLTFSYFAIFYFFPSQGFRMGTYGIQAIETYSVSSVGPFLSVCVSSRTETSEPAAPQRVGKNAGWRRLAQVSSNID
ncbi:MAG: PrgI family protein [Candidatus Moraniibacteriota bacterium]